MEKKRLLYSDDKVSALPHENPLSIKEIMINFLTYSVRIYVKKSGDSPPCYLGLKTNKAVWGVQRSSLIRSYNIR